jgi:nicotinamide-nucleotide adenylyltransferase
MRKRALFIFNWQNLSAKHLSFLEDQSKIVDELILLIDRTSIPLSNAAFAVQLPCGELMALLNSVLSARLNKPYYFFPVAGKGAPDLYYWLRCKMLCPPFEIIYTDKPELQPVLQAALQVPVKVMETFANESPIDLLAIPVETKPMNRGLFITRAQPFHLGHAAFIEQMKAEVEEVIVVIAMANISHQPADVATAGERMEMILPWLAATLPGRFYLSPLPYSDFTMENIYEMEHLLPSFRHVYTSNPVVEAMTSTAGYKVRSLNKPIAISATMIRQCILDDRPYKDYVPETVHHYLQTSAIPQRLKKIHEKESR